MIARQIESTIRSELRDGGKVIVLLGPRQVGKTTLLKQLRAGMRGRGEVLNGDYLDDRNLLVPERRALRELAQGLDYLFVDEAQNIEQIGTTLKLLHDEYPRVRVLATGSSSFDLSRRTGEPLTGRQISFKLFPIAWSELAPSTRDRTATIERSLVYGGYPESITIESAADRVDYLRQLVADYLLKDIFRQVDVDASKLTDLLRLIAFQIGSEVSLSEIGRQLHMDVKTVSRYLHFLEAAFVIVTLRGFSRNLRKEVAKSRKVYFVDLGIRNALIQAFQPLSARNDAGQLWENFLLVERMKRNAYQRTDTNYYFWRTYDRQEIDLIEEEHGHLRAYEFKYGHAKRRIPRAWQIAYPESESMIVTQENVAEFLT